MNIIYRVYLSAWSMVFAAMLLLPQCAQAAGGGDAELRVYEFPVLDLPYNGNAFPSMRQSMQMSNDFHYLLHNAWLDLVSDQSVNDPDDWLSQNLPIFIFDAVWGVMPLGQGWMHEEWHRAVLGRRGINSHNGIYDFNSFKSSTSSNLVYVDHVRDEDLIALKLNHPDEMVRLHSAGFESQYEQNLEFEKQGFFNDHFPAMGGAILLNYANNIYYMDMCASSAASNTQTDNANRLDGANVSARDFTGLDCTAWTYDLFRPNEPYAARGVHPSGVGINRYRKFSDLTVVEQRYLERQRNLSLLNLVDPFLFGQRQFATGSGEWLWNATLRHELTPFGYDIATNVFLKEREGSGVFCAVHSYSNDTGTYPGIEVALPRYPISLFDEASHITPRVLAWSQPKHLLFRDPSAKLGGLMSIRLDIPIGSGWEMYGELEGKTRGWVAGNEYLGGNVAMRFGLTKVMEMESRWKTQRLRQ